MFSSAPKFAALACAVYLFAPLTARAECWAPPQPQTMDETAAALGNSLGRDGRASEIRRRGDAALMLSGGGQRIAYAGGLLIGWSETGSRPEFAVVTAVDESALLAPFAFIGPSQDRRIADIINCEADSLDKLAQRAVSFLDEALMAKIAAKHEAGGRLFIALTGSAARPDTLWDIGLIAASGRPDALGHIRDILRASVNLGVKVDPAAVGVPAGKTITQNRAFKQFGLGEGVMPFSVAGRKLDHYYIIHNTVLPEQTSDYLSSRRSAQSGVQIVSVDEVSRSAAVRGHIAFPERPPRFTPQLAFDPAASKLLFEAAFRRGRMGADWRRLR